MYIEMFIEIKYHYLKDINYFCKWKSEQSDIFSLIYFLVLNNLHSPFKEIPCHTKC